MKGIGDEKLRKCMYLGKNIILISCQKRQGKKKKMKKKKEGAEIRNGVGRGK